MTSEGHFLNSEWKNFLQPFLQYTLQNPAFPCILATIHHPRNGEAQQG
jgi:hypothetical protein